MSVIAQPASASQRPPYASDPAHSRGRRFDEPPPANRTQFQRDRDRIIHANAFRRLEYKTQVFVNHEGDWFRTRLTHSLEVAQIARVIAASLGLDVDLTEAIALAHDLGHTPFGHAGQDELNRCLTELVPDAGGFEHNLQSLRVVDELEERYPGFNGLNLCFETREGILKHCSLANARKLGDVGKRFIDRTQPSLEAQLANLADEIAYNNHDVDDGLRSGLITLEQLICVPIFAQHYQSVRQTWPETTERRAVAETIRQMINTLIMDVTNHTRQSLARANPQSADEARLCGALVGFSDEIRQQANELKQFLFKELYRHFRVARMTHKARTVVRQLFETFIDEPGLLPPNYRRQERRAQARAIADYIAGMTDRYAMLEHRRIFAVDESH
jgi:dGTPase